MAGGGEEVPRRQVLRDEGGSGHRGVSGEKLPDGAGVPFWRDCQAGCYAEGVGRAGGGVAEGYVLAAASVRLGGVWANQLLSV